MHELHYLEALVLQDTLDGRIFTAGRELGLKDHAKGAVADNLALRVLHLFGLASQAILHLFANDLLRVVSLVRVSRAKLAVGPCHLTTHA